LQIPAPFVDVERAVYPWSERRTTEQYLDLLQSHSNHIQLADPTRNRLLKAVGDLVDRHGDTIETRHRTLLIKASREASASSVALTK
jgi:hypothetical protein